MVTLGAAPALKRNKEIVFVSCVCLGEGEVREQGEPSVVHEALTQIASYRERNERHRQARNH